MRTKFKLIPYNPILVSSAKELRNNMTRAECIAWKFLKKKQMAGFDFDRQRPLLNYIVDFFCYELYLGIEVDGASHENKFEYDKKREDQLGQYGIVLLRFKNEEVIFETEKVKNCIRNWIEDNIERRYQFLNN